MLMAFLVLINLCFPAMHTEIRYSLIYQVDKDLINFFLLCFAQRCPFISHSLITQLGGFFPRFKIQLILVSQHIIWGDE